MTGAMADTDKTPPIGRLACCLSNIDSERPEEVVMLYLRLAYRKRGSKRMASEWEELEGLTKEELIIELVKARRAMRNMC